MLFAPPNLPPKFEEGGDRRRPTSPCLTAAEKEKMIKLHKWFVATQNSAEQQNVEPQTSTRRQRAAADETLSKVANREFCDLTVEVRRLAARHVMVIIDLYSVA